MGYVILMILVVLFPVVFLMSILVILGEILF